MVEIVNMKQLNRERIFELLSSRGSVDFTDYNDGVQMILDKVKLNGDKALIQFTKEFDKVNLEDVGLKVTEEEFERAYKSVDDEFISAIRVAIDNIKSYHMKQKQNSWFTSDDEDIILGQKIGPVGSAGIYVPGGTAPYPSSVLMNALPAIVAGVKRIVMVTPPSKEGSVNAGILVAAKEVGVTEIYKVGGAQAIAALAFGTQTVPKVDKIVGPGNIYVATAKRLVYGYVDIDMIAGPSEILILADETANPRFVAADMLSQAEHDELASSILITTSESLAEKVKAELEIQTALLERSEIAEKSLADYGKIIITDTMEQAIELSDEIAPEHLEVCVKNPFELLNKIKNAGAIFLGDYAPEPLGDYIAGPNHVLPTSGTAKFFSPLSVDDFTKKSSVIYYSKDALRRVKDAAMRLAEQEGLTAHKNSIKVRFE
ncbi:histidinol dehydrogenase [Serpentinicella alkaliphila]|uniref:Histidinol dehydrogenase n=1 Tax=Serpentinicella alkaliphila TaxID=1734049 RepID=A0A4R2TID2_9FIRM|nr:histidinol dehydrogenase [Serpentinicella alkaliphila]QUH25003.1 histidinol dehydrogenase [Serpentinicella alkaliphila]TCQ02516.1 histidinol dehydrogenase [Serpentinicella alkaliphila]